MIFKKKEFFLLIFLIFLQSCSGGRIGNFLESSFNDLEKTRQNENLQNNLVNKKLLLRENKEIDYKKNTKIKKVQESKNTLENKKNTNLEKENKEIDDKKNKKIKIAENIENLEDPKNFQKNKKDINLQKITKQKNNTIKKISKKRKNELQSYKIIFILKDVDPKDPTEELSSILSNYEVNFEIEKIERILDSQKLKYE
ncbi:MAG: hypothetical protein JJ844_05935 [Prochlorococcus marinus CUG1435]|nr:hypothetical protein [Prochlorococcus marinus CUG1435]